MFKLLPVQGEGYKYFLHLEVKKLHADLSSKSIGCHQPQTWFKREARRAVRGGMRARVGYAQKKRLEMCKASTARETNQHAAVLTAKGSIPMAQHQATAATKVHERRVLNPNPPKERETQGSGGGRG